MKVSDIFSKGFLTRNEYLKLCTENVDCYFTANGRLVRNCKDINALEDGVVIRIHPRLRGGKGGFGSMLRAIGNQIEKTNNNDMCRDLSGRRIRDVNAETKLKEWYGNASERERAKLEKVLEKQRRRREALAKGPLHDHKFNDPEFSRRKEHIYAELQDAVEDLLKKIGADSSSAGPSKKRRKLWIETIDGYDLSSSDGDEDGNADSDVLSADSEPISSLSKSPQTDGNETEEPNPTSSKNRSADVRAPTPIAVDVQNASNFAVITDDVLSSVPSASHLESYGLESLKHALSIRGLKCGGTVSERASRLFSVRNLDPANYPFKLLATKPQK
ncbi:unnamed protein product [Rodentolepis nana]|uniref:Replication stress response regulator SDE2 n=1 Tax=Rodentolepis nana TaxID=102285 RepID=A0A0R3TK65_RODNA|nr:unnamed protein product [Rodentolepis nana]